MQNTQRIYIGYEKAFIFKQMYIVSTEACAVGRPYSDILVLTAADTEGHFPGG
jgi:hypothetical protein